MKDFLAVLGATTVTEGILVISACILKWCVKQDTTPSDCSTPCSVIPVDFPLEVS